MHLLESYSSVLGQQIRKPQLTEEYYPLPFEKYITLQPFTQHDAKDYDHWNEVINLIKPYLDKYNIKIVQIGKSGEKELQGTHSLVGKTSINQAFYVIKNSLLHCGADSFASHAASVYDIPIVSLYSNMRSDQSGPYFSSPEKVRLMDSPKYGRNPSYSIKENPKTINYIKPEQIAENVLDLLKIKYHFDFETVLFGGNYGNPLLELVPDSVSEINNANVKDLIIRMDLHFNESVLVKQSQYNNLIIITNKPLSPEVTEQIKDKTKHIYYEIDENYSTDFVKDLLDKDIKYTMFSIKSDEKISSYKFDLMDFGLIHKKNIPDPSKLDELKNRNLDNLYYISYKYTLSYGKVYPSAAAWKYDQPINGIRPEISKVIDDQLFWRELEYFYLLEKRT